MSDFARSFVHHLETLAENDRGALAELRRSLAFPPGAYPRAYPYVERFVGTEKHARDSSRLALYVVAGLYALHPAQGGRSLPAGMGEVMRRRDSASIEKRFVALLAADPDNLPDYLRPAVRLLAADGVSIDYATLLDDVSRWMNLRLDPDYRDRTRQRWAREFYCALDQREHVDQPEAANY